MPVILCVAVADGRVSARSEDDVSEPRIIGCWDRVKQDPREFQVEFCFHRDGTISGFFLEPTGEAGDLDKRWKLVAPSRLLINDTRSDEDEVCDLAMTANGLSFSFFKCGAKGLWRLNSKDPDHPHYPKRPPPNN